MAYNELDSLFDQSLRDSASTIQVSDLLIWDIVMSDINAQRAIIHLRSIGESYQKTLDKMRDENAKLRDMLINKNKIIIERNRQLISILQIPLQSKSKTIHAKQRNQLDRKP